MSAFQMITAREARLLASDDHTHIAVARFQKGEGAYLARDYMEAMRWLNMNRDYFYPGTENVIKIR